ncbi:MAG: hypothetical protein WCP55_03855 [Lentisphaerota bacterium]
MAEEIDTWLTDKPVCPYCGAIQGDDDLEPGMELKCTGCGEMMDLDIDYSPSYITKKIFKIPKEHLAPTEDSEWEDYRPYINDQRWVSGCYIISRWNPDQRYFEHMTSKNEWSGFGIDLGTSDEAWERLQPMLEKWHSKSQKR